jgi:ATP-binding cassette subfamily F protein 3
MFIHTLAEWRIYMLYQIKNGLVRYGADTIIENLNFEIRNTEKIALIGRNGCGKTTLFKLIAGIISLDNLDSDEDSGIYKAGRISIGYLQQISFDDENLSVEEELLKVYSSLRETEEKLNQLCVLMETNHSEDILRKYFKTLEQFEKDGGYNYRCEMDTVVTKFGFDIADLKRPISSFSGGQRTKLAFASCYLASRTLYAVG